ncbi:MAG: hypothetical protein HKN25_17260 [Pyrinomonadaceae bacterium]|nr:hypothetical protein [Pyrinomonadaceae bacterium]
MFCPSCGEADQKKGTYCRKCGGFLADFGKVKLSERPVDENFTANTVLTGLTGITSLVLAIVLYIMFLGRADTPVIIYIVAGFLTAMFAWQVQTFLRTLQLKKQFRNRDRQKAEMESAAVDSQPTKELLNEPDLGNVVPASVTENTTNNLKEKVRRSTQSEK